MCVMQGMEDITPSVHVEQLAMMCVTSTYHRTYRTATCVYSFTATLTLSLVS